MTTRSSRDWTLILLNILRNGRSSCRAAFSVIALLSIVKTLFCSSPYLDWYSEAADTRPKSALAFQITHRVVEPELGLGENGVCYVSLLVNVGKGSDGCYHLPTADLIYHCICTSSCGYRHVVGKWLFGRGFTFSEWLPGVKR